MINKKLTPLLLGGLGIGTTEFVMMGMLPDIANEWAISIPQAGHLISIYALGVVIGAPVLVMLGRLFSPKKMLLLLMVAFTLFNLLSAVSNSYPTMLATRFLSGLPHGAFFGIGAVVASKIAEKGKQASAIAVMFTGLTLANLLFVPLGTWIGHSFSWRFTFGIIGLIGLLTLIALLLWLPDTKNEASKNSRSELEIFKNKQVWLILFIIMIGTGGLFTWISYIAPLMTEVSRFSADSMFMIMVIAGLGMVAGNYAGGKLADRFQPENVCAALLLAMTIVLSAIYFFSYIQTVSLVLTFLAGALSIALAAPIQILMIRTAYKAEMLGASLTQAAFNIGNSLGAFFGGLPIIAGYGFQSPVLVGASMAVVGLLITMLLIRLNKYYMINAILD